MKYNIEISNRCFNISSNLLSVLNASFSGEFISLDDFLKIDGIENDSFFPAFDAEGNLKGFNLDLSCGYRDGDNDPCTDRISINLERDYGVVYYTRFCLYEGTIPINEINKAVITRDDDSIIISYSKVVNDGHTDYEDCSNHFVDMLQIEDVESNDLFAVFDNSVEQNKILK